MSDEWLSKLQPGDKVIVNGFSKSVETVARVTKTMIFLEGTVFRYSKCNGIRIDKRSRWSKWPLLEEATPQSVEKIENVLLAEKLRSIIDKVDFKKVDILKLAKIVDILSGEVVK